ncbi:MAG: PBS lyase, partial [Planctomycetota bacterium]
DRKLVLDVLKLHPSPDAFLLATELAEAGDLTTEATEVAAAIAQKLGGEGIDLDRLKSVFGSKSVELEILEAKYGAGDNWQDVTTVLQKYTGQLPWVSLPSPNYNQSFGGDPAPGVPKQLRVRYKLNGKEGEVSLAENALVLLPAPKQ